MSDDERDVTEAMRTIKADYYRSIRSLADGIRDEIKDEKPDDREEWLHDRIHETADGSYWVIYTHANLRVMMASDNWLAAEEEGIDLDGPLSETLPKHTYYAVCADLRAELEGLADEDSDEDSDDE